MLTPITGGTLLPVCDASKGSDIYSILKRLEQKVLNYSNQIELQEYEDVNGRAAHILCVASEKIYGKSLVSNPNITLDQHINYSLKRRAYENWGKRIKYKISGNEQIDWENSIDRFAKECFNIYYPPQYKAVT